MQFSPPTLTDIANLALLEIGSRPIDDIDDLNTGSSGDAIRVAFWPAVRETGRSHPWGCLKKRLNLTQLSFPNEEYYSSFGTAIGWPGCYPSTPPPYWLPNTLYSGGNLVTYGQAIYYFLGPSGPQVSTNNFINDLSAGLWGQIYSSFYQSQVGPAGRQYEWQFGYALPTDYLLLNELNGVGCYFGKGKGDLYEIFNNQVTNSQSQNVSNQTALFCDQPYADIKYTALIQDPTVWDPLFINAVAVLLGSKIATTVLGDSGVMMQKLKAKFDNEVLPDAQLKSAGEMKVPRYDPTRDSNFLRSRYGSTAG